MSLSEIPSSFEIRIAKWIFLPILGAAFVLAIVGYYSSKHDCQSKCEENGYGRYKYFPADRGGMEQCLCMDPNDPNKRDKLEIYLK
ncbi:MAG: hypothetical protein C0622_06450 [Desulfuromonas sp.]|nr:MAG: hypothetical protein C0622_06450 [Desulfuromonas sp.]